MSIVPSIVLLDYVSTKEDEQPTTIFFTCGGIKETNVKYIQNMKIYRLTRNDLPGDSGVGPVIASFDAITQNAEIIIDELKSRATVSGNIDTTLWTQSTLVVTFETVQLQCKDEGMYTCEINYETTGFISRSARDSTNLTTNGMYNLRKVPYELPVNSVFSGTETLKRVHNFFKSFYFLKIIKQCRFRSDGLYARLHFMQNYDIAMLAKARIRDACERLEDI